MKDPVKLVTATGDTNNIITVPCYVHKLAIYNATVTNNPLMELHDATTVTGTAKLTFNVNPTFNATNFQQYAEANFDPPFRFEIAVSLNITGTGLYHIFYTNA